MRPQGCFRRCPLSSGAIGRLKSLHVRMKFCPSCGGDERTELLGRPSFLSLA